MEDTDEEEEEGKEKEGEEQKENSAKSDEGLEILKVRILWISHIKFRSKLVRTV